MEWRYFVDGGNGRLWESDQNGIHPKQLLTPTVRTHPPVFYPLPELAQPGDWLYDEASNFIFRWDGGLTFMEDGCVLTGDHGGTLDEPQIQPQDYIRQNGLGWEAGNVIKYVTRYRHKGGQADLRKALDYLHKLMQEYEDPQNPA